MSMRLSALNMAFEVPSPTGVDYAVVQTQDIATVGEMTLVIEATVDGGTWFMVPATAIGKGSQVTKIWTNGRWFVETLNFIAIRVRVSEYTAGSRVFAVVDISPSTAADSRVPVVFETSDTDLQGRRLAEVQELLLASNAVRDQELWGSDKYGNEVR